MPKKLLTNPGEFTASQYRWSASRQQRIHATQAVLLVVQR